MFSKTRQHFKAAYSSLWKNKYRILLAGLVLALLLGCFNFMSSSQIAATQMSLNYPEASYGLNPNSTWFSIGEFTSDEVMEKAINYAGLEGKISPQELAECISVKQIDAKGSDKESYITTSFNIYYDGSKIDTENRSAVNMLNLICKSYKEFFMEHYGDNQSLLTDGSKESRSTEPFFRLNSLSIRANQLERYVDARIQENKSYKDENLDYTFTTLLKKLQNIMDYDIPNIHAFILESGVAEDCNKLTDTLEYRNLIEKLDYDEAMANYDSDNAGIDLYDVVMSSIVMIPTENDRDEYYMSRTQTAIDYLAKDADSNLADATVSQEKLTDTAYMISQIQLLNGLTAPAEEIETEAEDGEEAAAPDSPALDEEALRLNLEKTNTMLDSLEANLSVITDDLRILDTSYIKYRTQDYLVFRSSSSSFSQKINVKAIAAVEIAFLLLCFTLDYARICRRKEHGVNEEV